MSPPSVSWGRGMGSGQDGPASIGRTTPGDWRPRRGHASDMEVAQPMRLAKLTLCGFKSFADRTEFSFDDAITGIVGPNGCGKSNIVDAIKWVLGERSSKSLRGKEMIDVIFAGSSGRKPAGMASVTLSFENPVIDASAEVVELQYGDQVPGSDEVLSPEPSGPEPVEARVSSRDPGPQDAAPQDPPAASVLRARRRALPIEADVVEVERRLFRDGTSKYLINGRNARLRDIRDLFLDTGIGADAYSIIEQGKVDAMLLASPQERRTIFEEAAGVAKYKQRRIEAQRKLERAQANLALTREQLASTERRLRLVKGQAAKARRFRELDEQLRASRLALAFDQYDDVRQRLDGLTSRLAELEGTRAQAEAALAGLEAAKQEAEIARHELHERHKGLDEQRLAARHAEQSAAQRKAMTERALEDARRQAASDQERLRDIEGRIKGLLDGVEQQGQAIAALSERLADAERALEGAASGRAAILERRAERQGLLAERRGAAANIDRERASILASVEADKRREESLREQLRRNQDRAAALASDCQQRASALEASRASIGARRARIGELESALSGHESAAAALSGSRRELASRASGLEQHVLRLDTRRATLQEMVEAREGLGDAAREVLARKEANLGFAGVLAPLADLIETDREHAAAVEAALGASLQALVVPHLGAMPGPEELAGLSGRVVFVPLAGLAERGPGLSPAHRWREDGIDSALIQSGRVMPLRSVVRLREGAADLPGEAGTGGSVRSALLDRLLGSAFLVDNLDGAMMLAAASPGARFVTRDGSVMEADGRIITGPMAAGPEGAGVLQRRSELADLKAELAELSAALAQERAQLQAVDAEAAAVAAQQGEARARLAGEQRQLVGDQARQEQLASELSRLERDGRHMDEESQQLAHRLATVEQDRSRLLERAERLKALHDEQAAAARGLEEELAAIGVCAEAAGDQITALKVETGRLSEQLGQARREHRRLEGAAEAAERERQELERVVAQSRSRLSEHERAISIAAAQIQDHGAEAGRLEALVAAAAGEVAGMDVRVQELGRELGSARAHAQHVERDWHALEVSRRELEVKREGLEERTSQDLDLDLSREYGEYRLLFEPDGSGVTVLRIDQAQTQADIEALREGVRRLGAVNLEAIEEEMQLESRNEELIRQVADIDEAARKLSELIETLNAASRERFGATLARIQEHFAGQQGMFRKLFGGGRAEVRLMPLVKEIETPEGPKKVETDEVDLLESGIEVIAKPPGKEPRSISQLSGGERTLTAVALLLAIFRSKPGCFCVLDEVDAALDEGNVSRYCAVVREFTLHSQFIVITHNSRTMSAADRLYGVTMQERGVSTRVSVKFEQVGKDGQIRAGAGHDPEPARMVSVAPPSLPEDGGNGEARSGENGKRRNLLREALAGMRDGESVASH
jgi:chromosome segregation protein